MPYLGPITNAAPAPDVELENTEIPVKLGLRFAIESRRFANGLDIPEIETKPVQSEENVMLTCTIIDHLIYQLKSGCFQSYYSLYSFQDE